MPNINVLVKNKIATADGTIYVCGNSDFVIDFEFDSEWDAFETKTARFAYNGSYVDVVFTGNQCAVPIINNTFFFNVGCFAGDLHTTTAARVPCKKSILCGSGSPADPAPDVYNQIMELIQGLGTPDPEDIAKAVADYLKEHPLDEKDPTVPAWAKAAEKPAYTAEEVGAIGDDELPTAIDMALAQAKASGEFDGAKGDKGDTGENGAPGANGITPTIGGNGNWYLNTTDTGKPSRGEKGADGAGMDVTGATVGQIAKISAVDDNGVPTAWETIDGYTGQVTVEKLINPDHGTDLVQYAAFQAAVPIVQQMNISGATAGQIIKVKAVDWEGHPTAWEPVDMPSGGEGGEWVLAGSATAESADMVLKVSNIHAKHILVSLYASCDETSNKSYHIKLNDAINAVRSNGLPSNGEKHLWAVEFELLTVGDENYIYCRIWPNEAHHANKSNDPATFMYTTTIEGTMWYRTSISEFNSVTFLSTNGTASAGNIMNVWCR